MRRNILFVAPTLGPDVVAMTRILERANLLESLVTRAVSFSRRPASPVAPERTEAKWPADLVFYFTLALTRSRTRATDRSFAFLDRFASSRVTADLGAVFARDDCCWQSFHR